jgi:hypothetical protein
MRQEVLRLIEQMEVAKTDIFPRRSPQELFRLRVGPASAIKLEPVPATVKASDFDFVEKHHGHKWKTHFVTGQNQIGGFKRHAGKMPDHLHELGEHPERMRQESIHAHLIKHHT